MRKLGAWIILFLLIVVPFINWQLGALIWMCAFLVYILQQVFKGNPFSISTSQGEEENEKTTDEKKITDDNSK